MVLGHNVECSLHIWNQNMSIFHFNSKFSFDGLMDMDAGLDVNKSSLITPMSIEWNRYSLSYTYITFHLSGSIWLSLLWTTLMMRFAVSPGYFIIGLHGDEFSCVWEVGYSCIWGWMRVFWQSVTRGDLSWINNDFNNQSPNTILIDQITNLWLDSITSSHSNPS